MIGILNILKPTGMTSHDVVSNVRKILNIKKVGHAGTLDPNVAGVLVICVGKATKFSEYLMSGDKEYVCELILGQSTDTQDSYGMVIDKSDKVSVTREELNEVLKKFTGELIQIPPAYSAVKLHGKKLYEYARQNIQVEKQGRPINIKSIELLKFDGNKALLKVRCSKGTYIRTLCNDIGKSLGTFGHMGILIRTESKGLHINNSVTLEKLKYLNDSNKLDECLIPVESIYKLDKINVESKYYDRLTAGNEVEAGLNTDSDKFYVYCRNSLIGIGKKVKDNTIKIDKMLR
ncbi:MAG TPA: tRNA pseudouridine(55) synthase TruB [Sedimentibacter sp.]|jgi:tRNA pseudouridine55 synthase|nr:tRNA pseudouridine(55) synthase TruB [Sedimentibacter sp.]HAS91167.1 tRNA pseudouridine(55) synthase TruB [Clostridiales bacterium]HOA19912.1 tRNA pseudouridine(55) synthase TruB [Sedimentibacter sp.]HOG63075.1 tRNA pseudouridine(55) synthase TruB [Sedimentibacter sp.]HPV85501.1 tRNA pseudouridine(55) synthase TruB [Sedimentibacter sp.]